MKKMKRFALIKLVLLFLPVCLLIFLFTPYLFAEGKKKQKASLHIGFIVNEILLPSTVPSDIGLYLIESAEDASDIKIYSEFFSDAQSLIQAMKQGKIDGAHTGIMTYLKLHQEIGVIPFFTFAVDGRKSSPMHVFVHKESKIEKIEDLKGKTLIYYDKSSPNYLFLESLLRKKGLGKPEYFFSSCNKASSRISAMYAVLFKRADAVVELEEILRSPRNKKNLISIYKFDYSIPVTVLSYRSNIDPGIVEKVKKVLLQPEIGKDALKRLTNSSHSIVRETFKSYSSLQIIPCKDSDFDWFRKALKELGIKY